MSFSLPSFSQADPVKNLYRGWSGEYCHPESPSGGGGAGSFMSAGSLGLEPSTPALPHPDSPAAKSLSPGEAAVAAQSGDFTLPEMADVMERHGWVKGALLMREWLNGDRRPMTKPEKEGTVKARDYPIIDTQTLTMAWALGFPRAREAYDRLRKNLKTDNALKALKGKLQTNLNARPTISEIRNQMDPVALHSDWQFQFEKVGWTLDFDDMSVALNEFAFYAAVLEGSVTRSTAGASATITKVGIYLRDTYDFIGPQYLGHWNHDGVFWTGFGAIDEGLGKEAYLPSWGPVAWPFNNSDFRDYQDRTLKGGDMMIFSDVTPESCNLVCSF